MATRIELPKELVRNAFETNIASLKRAINTAKTEMVKEAYRHELAQITNALASITEVK